MKKYILLTLTLLVVSAGMAQKAPQTKEIEFWVAGVCGMCEKTIENAVDVKGIVFGDYNLETHKLKLVYKPKKITEQKIHQLINQAGYDTEISVATDEQYNRVHGCCKYRSLEDH